MALNWQTDKSKLVDGECYLVKMKHGIISGYWVAEEGIFRGYYWRDIEWYGHAWVPISEVE
mgnify:CR=1 FL=1